MLSEWKGLSYAAVEGQEKLGRLEEAEPNA